jgi:beta-lactam-binding protein with PASTA domain
VVLVVLLGGWYYVTQTEQGRLWLLGLTSRTEVPNVVGQSQTSAEAALQEAGLRVGQVSSEATLAASPGVVVRQEPVQGETVAKHSEVAIAVSAVPTVTVADVVGHKESDAMIVLAEQGLRASVQYANSSSVPAGEVIEQSPAGGAQAAVGSIVGLTVSKGKQQGQVPNVVGLPQNDANGVLSAAGFKVVTVKATSTSVPAGDVIAQSPAAGTVTSAGSSVTITVSTGAPAPAPSPPPAPAPAPKPEPSKTEVPDVVGMRVLEAVTTLQKSELKVAFQWEKSSGNFLKVIEQAPTAGSTATPGDTVTITIGLPVFSFEMPSPPPSERPTTAPEPSPIPSPSPQPTAP